MKTRMTIIAAAVALMFAGADPALALHEDEWGNVKSHGNVTVEQDDADEWGPWEQFIQPAAPGPSLVFLPQLRELYRILPVVGAEEESPYKYMGYSMWWNSSWSHDYGGGEYGDVYEQHGPFPGRFGLNLETTGPGEEYNSGYYYQYTRYPIEADWGNTPLFGSPTPRFSVSGPLSGYLYDYVDDYYYGDNFGADRSDSADGENDYAYVSGYTKHNWWWYGYTGNEDVAVGWFDRSVSRYVSGGDGEDSYTESWDGAEGYYVVGQTTPAADLQSLRVNAITATYDGSTSGWWSGYPAPVHMEVNFGTGNWTGSWNNGQDGAVSFHTDSGGREYVHGQVGFNASGKVVGANFSATQLSANDGTVTGNVAGSFYGPEARTAAGVVDIVKSTEGYTNKRHTDLFVVTKTVGN